MSLLDIYLLDIYLRDFAAEPEGTPDLFAPELIAFNTKRLNDLWKLVCERDAQARPGTTELSPLPYWGIVWPGSRALARYIFDHREEFRDRRVLDIGTGSGLAALACAKVGAARVVGVDVDAMGPALAGHAAVVNGLSKRCEWRSADALRYNEAELREFDVLLAGDVFYEAEFAQRSLELVRRGLNCGLENLLADPGRNHRPQARQSALAKTGMRLKSVAEYRVPVYEDIEGIRRRDTTLFRLLEA